MKGAVVAFKWRPVGARRTSYFFGVCLSWPGDNPDAHCRVLSTRNDLCRPFTSDTYRAGQADEKGRIPLTEADTPYIQEIVEKHLAARKTRGEPVAARVELSGPTPGRGRLAARDIPWHLAQTQSTAVPHEIALPIQNGARGGRYSSSALTSDFERYTMDGPGEIAGVLNDIALHFRHPRYYAVLEQTAVNGQTEAQVAEELGISRDQVQYYRRGALAYARTLFEAMAEDEEAA